MAANTKHFKHLLNRLLYTISSLYSIAFQYSPGLSLWVEGKLDTSKSHNELNTTNEVYNLLCMYFE